MTCPESHSKLVAEPGLETRLHCLKMGLVPMQHFLIVPPLWTPRRCWDCNPTGIRGLDSARGWLAGVMGTWGSECLQITPVDGSSRERSVH